MVADLLILLSGATVSDTDAKGNTCIYMGCHLGFDIFTVYRIGMTAAFNLPNAGGTARHCIVLVDMVTFVWPNNCKTAA